MEKTVLLEKFNQERMADAHRTAAIVLASSDPAKAGEFLLKYLDSLLPETARAKEATIETRMKELQEFSKKEVKLTSDRDGGLSLSVDLGSLGIVGAGSK